MPRSCGLAAVLFAAIVTTAGAEDIAFDLDAFDPAVLQPGRDAGCNLEETVDAFGIWSIDIGDQDILYGVPCAISDLNVPMYVVLEDENGFTTLQFPDRDGTESLTAMAPGWNQPSQLIVSTTYNSSQADCGISKGYELDRQTNSLSIVYIRQKRECDGNQIDLGQWSSVFEAR